MKYIKKFNEESEKSIEEWCKQFRLYKYKINDDETVDVEIGVHIAKMESVEIPIQFGVINGYFDCNSNKLKSLKGCPKITKGGFNCSYNQLTSLIYGPIEVLGNYWCSDNRLITLEGCADNIGGYLSNANNPIYEVYKIFSIDIFNTHTYKRYKDSLDYNYLRGTNIIKLRFKEACEEAGIEMPESIPGYKYI